LGPEIPAGIKATLREFLGHFPVEDQAWTSIEQALKGTVPRLPSRSELVEIIRMFFGV
jgi:hypothetical protein